MVLIVNPEMKTVSEWAESKGVNLAKNVEFNKMICESDLDEYLSIPGVVKNEDDSLVDIDQFKEKPKNKGGRPKGSKNKQ